MLGQMQDWRLRVTHILDHAARFHGLRPVVSRMDGGIARSDWEQIHLRARRFAQALRRLGIAEGDVVGCMAWNTARHLEAWYGVPGMGAVLHTLNPRLSAEELTYIINHAEDRWILCDADLAPIIAGLMPGLKTVRGCIVLTGRAGMPDDAPPDALCYEDLLAAEDGDTAWTEGEEGAACGICYTSGTTGRPKGVVYSHRSNVLHAMAMIQPDMLGLSSRDVLMPVVPLFHANGWSTGFSGPMSGAAMVMPGRDLTAPGLYGMLSEGVTITAAVPTVWLQLLAHLQAEGLELPHLDRVVIGGSACPKAVIEAFQRDYGVRVLHAWGMTETSPLGSFCSFKPEIAALPPDQQMERQLTVGHPPFTVDLEVQDEDGAPLPWDGQTQGRLKVRGSGVVRRYLKDSEDAIDARGWFDTGDAATMDGSGYVRITDRFKDVIKSGGEWISSIELENRAVSHPAVAEAAAVGVPHPKWGERPVLVVVPRPGPRSDTLGEEILALLRPHFAAWQLPDDILFVAEIPHTATGKISKLTLRRQMEEQGYRLPA